jgi:hypothetical protein
MFLGPLEQAKPWNTGISGFGFLKNCVVCILMNTI